MMIGFNHLGAPLLNHGPSRQGKGIMVQCNIFIASHHQLS